MEAGARSGPNGEPNADDGGEQKAGGNGSLDSIERMHDADSFIFSMVSVLQKAMPDRVDRRLLGARDDDHIRNMPDEASPGNRHTTRG